MYSKDEVTKGSRRKGINIDFMKLCKNIKTKLPVLNVLTDPSDEQKLLETVIQYFS
ncbi:hypothetical protein FACS1894193_01050 [Bacilli bacterium]|nr:hypothetical protein FACS1894193_01050 [Bacilli bacterium]